jgi:O-acetylhomoserine (thiol)-lyase
LRMDRISDNALQVARFLKQHSKVAWVNYAGLEEHPDHALVKKYLSGRASGLLTFGVKGPAGEGRKRGARFLDALGLFTRLVNIGDVRSLATHPASTTHRQLSEAELKQAGVSEDTVRLSVGIEDSKDILQDLDQALAAV